MFISLQVHRMLPSTPHLASLAVMGLHRLKPLHYRRFITHQEVMVITLVVALSVTCSVEAQDDFCSADLATLGRYPDVVVVPDSSSAAASRDSGLLAGCASDTAYLKCNGTQVLPFTATDRPQEAQVMCNGTSYTWMRVMSDGTHVDLTSSPACTQRCSDMCEHFVSDSDLYKTVDAATNVTKQAQNSGVLFRGCDYEVFVLNCVDSAATIHINYTQLPENIVHNNLDLGSATLKATCTTGASSTEKLYTTDSAAYAKIPANTNTKYSCFAPITTTEPPTTTTEVTTTTPATTTTATTVAITTVLNTTTTVPVTTTTTQVTTTAAGATNATSGATTAASAATTTGTGATTAAQGASTAGTGTSTTKVATIVVTNPDGSAVTSAGGSAVTVANGTYVVTNPGGSIVTNSAGAVVTYSSNSVVVTNADGSAVTNADGSAVTGPGTTTTASGSGTSTAAPGLGGMTTTSAGPSTAPPLVLPTKSPVDSTYSRTTDQYIGTLQNNMTDTDGVNATYAATDAPFGFGYAVLIESAKKQCLKQTSFNVPNGTLPCMSDPGSCIGSGISFSIWEKHVFSADIFNRYNAMTEADIKYVLSTGGDEFGHPGIALYHHGIYQIAIVSTGDRYWRVRVPGQMFNGTWCNIGIRWNPNITNDANGVPISGGLHMLINLKVVGHSYLPVTVPSSKPGLAPPELMLGCHKTQGEQTYRYFGDGEYDELASWNHALPENETFFFLGGYEGNFSNVTPEQMATMLGNVNLKDPAQFAAALTILGKMTQTNEKPTSAPDTTATSTILAGTSPTPSGPNQLSALSEAQNLQRREALLDIMDTLLNPKNLGDPDGLLTQAQGVPYLDTLDLASNLLDMNSADEWHHLQANGSAGAASLMWKLDQFIGASFCRIKFDNNTAPLTVVKSTKNIIFVGQRMLVETLRGKGSYVVLPDFNMKELKDKKVEWNNIYDSIRLPTGVMSDDRCDKRPVCVITMIYDTYDNVGPSPVNFANVPRNTIQKMDSRLISFKINADKGRKPLYTGDVDKNAQLCWPDPIALNKDPFYFRVEHNTPTVSVNRGLKFHSEEVVTQVLERRCAWWNANLSDFGVFDSSGCYIYETSALSTSCACNRFGIVVVLAEQVKPAEVPAEESWLTLVKYILYGISGILLILYSIVVLYSPVLKEQFHLLGMNLSLAVLLGSVFMCVSDMPSIRQSRHMCTTISTLIHFFYVAAGGLVACLGHASFKAITAGVVGGKLNSYTCIAWGLALVSVGVPFAFFITDLGTDPRCFISWENYGKATFFVPQTVYVVIAFFFGFVVMCNMSTPALRKENLIDDFGSFCRGASFVLIYFAITWCLGIPAYMRFDQTTDFFPMFQIMNSMTGIIIFLFIGLASNRYRGVLVGKAKAKQQKILSLAAAKGVGGKQKLKEDMPPPTTKPVAPADQASTRPSTGASLKPPGQVAGRPGSRPVTPQL